MLSELQRMQKYRRLQDRVARDRKQTYYGSLALPGHAKPGYSKMDVAGNRPFHRLRLQLASPTPLYQCHYQHGVPVQISLTERGLRRDFIQDIRYDPRKRFLVGSHPQPNMHHRPVDFSIDDGDCWREPCIILASSLWSENNGFYDGAEVGLPIRELLGPKTQPEHVRALLEYLQGGGSRKTADARKSNNNEEENNENRDSGNVRGGHRAPRFLSEKHHDADELVLPGFVFYRRVPLPEGLPPSLHDASSMAAAKKRHRRPHGRVAKQATLAVRRLTRREQEPRPGKGHRHSRSPVFEATMLNVREFK